MSRPRSGSTRYPTHHWEEQNFGRPQQHPEKDPQMDQSRHLRRDPRDYDHFRKPQRRSPPRPRDREYECQRSEDHEEFHHRRLSPRQDYERRGFSSHCKGGFKGEHHRGGSRDDFPTYHQRCRSPCSPLRVQRERLPSETRHRSDFSDVPSTSSWISEEQEREPEFRPDRGHNDQRFSSGDRSGHGFNKDGERLDPHDKRSHRRKDNHSHGGFRNDEPFGKQSLDADGFAGKPRSGQLLGDFRHSGPLIIDHGHGVGDEPGPQEWDRAARYGDCESKVKRHRSSSQEHFGTSNSRTDHGEFKGRSFRDDRESAHLDPEKDSQDQMYTEKRTWDRPVAQRGKKWPHLDKGRSNQRPTNWNKNPQNVQKQYQPRQQVSGFHHQRDKSYQRGDELDQTFQHQPNPGRPTRPESLERDLTREDMNPKMPRVWLQQLENVTNQTTESKEETLTIKVDMSRPANHESSACYSADRQLSLDLVNVGRQRLDFLPMLKHSGTFTETSVHVGTFAEEIITLVHHVKEVYFKGEDITLNQRFSTPSVVLQEEEKEELTLNQRFSSNRGFQLDLDSLLDEDEPPFDSMDDLQKPHREPGDLRHNLEKMRQERLEGVRVTIAGGAASPQPLLTSLSGWISTLRTEEVATKTNIHMGRRRGFFRQNGVGRNSRRGFGPMRRQNNCNNSADPSW